MRRTRALWPESRLYLVCRKGLGDFFLRLGLVDRVFEIVKGDEVSYRQVLRELNGDQIDYLIVPHESWRTAFFTRHVKARHKIGFQKFMKGFFFDELIPREGDLPDALRQLSLLRLEDPALGREIQEYRREARPYVPSEEGLLSAPPNWASMSLRLQLLADREALTAVLTRFQLSETQLARSVLIFPGSVWATKRWTENGFVQTSLGLQKRGYNILVMGGPGEEDLSEKVGARIPGSRCLAGQSSLYESAQLIAHAALVIGNDSASSHLAALCDTPLVVVFGPTVIDFGYRPWSGKTFLAESRQLSCRPCGAHGPQKCPLGTHECMKHVSAAEVLQKAELALRL